MTKAELLQALATKFFKVGTPHADGSIDEFGFQSYLVKTIDKVGDSIRDQNYRFYVEDDGGPAEAAYWSPEPKPDPVSGFQKELRTYIEGKIGDNTIEAAYIESIDVANETAIAKVVMPDLSEVRVFLDKDAGNLRHRLIT